MRCILLVEKCFKKLSVPPLPTAIVEFTLLQARETNLKVPARITEIDLTSTQYDETAAPAAAGQHSQMPIANAAGLELTQQLPQERWTAPQGVHSRLSPPLSKAFAKIFDGINPDGK